MLEIVPPISLCLFFSNISHFHFVPDLVPEIVPEAGVRNRGKQVRTQASQPASKHPVASGSHALLGSGIKAGAKAPLSIWHPSPGPPSTKRSKKTSTQTSNAPRTLKHLAPKPWSAKPEKKQKSKNERKEKRRLQAMRVGKIQGDFQTKQNNR